MDIWKNCSVDAGNGKILELTCIPPLVETIIFWLLTFAGIVALFIVIYGGVKFISSHGDPKSVDGARKTITHAILGLILIFLSFFILNLIGQVTNTNCITSFGFTNCNTGQELNPAP